MTKKRCLIISPGDSVFKEPLERAFERAGLEVVSMDCRQHALLSGSNMLRRVWSRLPVSARNRGYQYALKQINNNIIKTAREFKPDLIFVMKGKELSNEALDILKTIAPTANWYPETIDHWGGIQEVAPHFNYFFAFDDIIVEKLKEEGHPNVHYLPFCADITADTMWPQESPDLKYNVSFIGTYHPERSDREHILAKTADYGLHIWGGPAWQKTSLKAHYHGAISNEAMLDVYRSSKIVINHYIVGLPGTGINLRPFEVTGAGALLINHDERSDIFRHFKDGEEFIAFSSEDDIRAKVAHYMENEHQRRGIAQNGFLRTQRDHTYDIRVATVLGVTGLL